jgi:hypothetical protein
MEVMEDNAYESPRAYTPIELARELRGWIRWPAIADVLVCLFIIVVMLALPLPGVRTYHRGDSNKRLERKAAIEMHQQAP